MCITYVGEFWFIEKQVPSCGRTPQSELFILGGFLLLHYALQLNAKIYIFFVLKRCCLYRLDSSTYASIPNHDRLVQDTKLLPMALKTEAKMSRLPTYLPTYLL